MKESTFKCDFSGVVLELVGKEKKKHLNNIKIKKIQTDGILMHFAKSLQLELGHVELDVDPKNGAELRATEGTHGLNDLFRLHFRLAHDRLHLHLGFQSPKETEK